MHKMIERLLKKELLISSKEMPVVSLSGPRQSGKTTLAKEAFPLYRYINLEKPNERHLALQDPNTFLADNVSEGMIIDEAQRAPDLFSYIQVLVDENPNKKIILTGSQDFLLSKRINQSLAGRVRVLHLLPLSVSELLSEAYEYDNHIPYIFRGGYPRLYGTPATPERWFPSYIRTYLERDVRDFIHVKEIDQFQIFLQMCAARIGQLFNYTEISNAVGVSDNTIRHWLSVLEASYIVYRIPPYFKNLGKRLIKSRKLYFYDTGVACHLLGIRKENQLLTHYNYGGLFENFIVNEVTKYFMNNGERPQLYYWRESNGTEIDLIIDRGLDLIPVEIKASKTPKTDFMKNIKKVRKLPKASHIHPGFVIYGGSDSFGNIISWKDLQKEILEKLEG